MARPVTLHQLAVFQAVARHLNYTRAAAELHLTQPAVSRQVQQLEDSLRVALFSQRSRRIQLTDAGRDVLSYAQQITGLLDELQEALGDRAAVRRGTLRLIATSTAGEYLLPPLAAAFQRSHPGVHVMLRVTNREQVLQALADGQADLAVMGRPPARDDWLSRPILANELVAIASPSHPCLGGPAVEPSRLARETFFLREPGSGTRLAVEGFLREAGLPPDQAVELGSDSAIKQAVMAGLGISILSRQAIELELGVARLAILEVVGLPLRRQWFLVRPLERRPAPASVAFSAFLEHALGRALQLAEQP